MAIGHGLDAILLGRAEVMLYGGSDAAITRIGIAGFGPMRALSRRNDDPAAASRPFDADRSQPSPPHLRSRTPSRRGSA
jgi:3-oxoacyl-[acyl-carrier-protein] synthase II